MTLTCLWKQFSSLGLEKKFLLVLNFKRKENILGVDSTRTIDKPAMGFQIGTGLGFIDIPVLIGERGKESEWAAWKLVSCVALH